MADERIGVDESGKGDYFGPLVIAACFVAPWHVSELEGVKDSKKLTDLQALKLSDQIKKVCPHSIVAIGPVKYNELYAKIGNLNRLLEWGHAQAIENVLKAQPCRLVISDQFANPAGLQRSLAKKGLDVDLVSMVRAESDLAVAAASILARAEFLRRLDSLGKENGITLLKGAGSPVLALAKKLAKEGGRELLGKVAKMHFKTTLQAMGEA
jgi:ribonuclease HIII